MADSIGIIGRLRASRAARCLGLAVFLSAVTTLPLLHNLRHAEAHAHAGHGPAPGAPGHGQGELEHFGAAYAGAAMFVLLVGVEPLPLAAGLPLVSTPEAGVWPTPLQPRAPPVSLSIR